MGSVDGRSKGRGRDKAGYSSSHPYLSVLDSISFSSVIPLWPQACRILASAGDPPLGWDKATFFFSIVWEGGVVGERRILSRLHAVSTEPDVGLDLTKRDIMT